MKKRIRIGLTLLALLLLAACAKEETIVHCDGCGTELRYPASGEVNEDWIILCPDCRKKLQTED